MERKRDKLRLWVPAVVAVLAAGYFLLTYNRTLNSIDEGILLYNFQKAATGQIPHRDFYDVYGPASYWVAGGLFKLFGIKIIVIRVFLLLLKAAMAMLVFLIARKLLPVFFALLAAALFIFNWGDPLLSAMNIFYAGHFSHFLMLLGVFLMMLYVERGSKLWLLGVGVCMGVSVLFKFHAGVIGFMGFAIFLSLKERALGEGPDDPDSTASPPSGIVDGILRAGKCLGSVGVIVFYLVLFSRYRLDAYYFFIFLLPLFILLGHVLFMDAKAFGAGAGRASAGLRECYFDMLILTLPPIFFFAFEIGYFRVVGGLDEFIYDTFELPLQLVYYREMADYGLHAALIAGVVALVLIEIGIGKRLREGGNAARAGLWGSSIALMLLVPAVLILNGTPMDMWHLRTVHVLPTATLLLSVYLFMGRWRKERELGANTNDSLFLALAIVFACQAFLISFPRTDETHIQINTTILFVLVAFLLQRMHSGWESLMPDGGRVRGFISTAACFALLAAPLVWSVKPLYSASHSELERPFKTLKLGFPRTEGLDVPLWSSRHYPSIWRDIVRVARYVKKHTESGDTIFLVCEPQIIYFLSERESFLGKENYFAHLAAMRLIDRADAVRLSDEQMLEKLIAAKPRLIIRSPGGESTESIVALWPGTAAYIEEQYRTKQTISVIYEVLEPRPRGQNERLRSSAKEDDRGTVDAASAP